MSAAASDRDLLLRAVLEFPDEDTPRLAYADWLDENGGESDAERAEFIRIQIKIARSAPTQVMCDRTKRLLVTAGHRPYTSKPGVLVSIPYSFRCRCKACTLARREDRLWLKHGNEWRREALAHPYAAFDELVGCEFFGSDPPNRDEWLWLFQQDVVTFRRGFPEEFKMPLAAWLAHGPAVVRAHPVTRVVSAGIEPWRDAGGGPSIFGWWRSSAWPDPVGRNAIGNLPDDVFDAMAELYPDNFMSAGGPPNNQHIAFDDADAANAALSAALIAWAKAQPT